MKSFLVFLLLIWSNIALAFEDLPTPYNELTEVLPLNLHGWYLNAEPMEKLIKSRNVKLVIELGSWLGRSTCHIAKTLPEGGIVFAVDHWLGNPQSRINSPHLIPILYEQFLSNIIREGLTQKIIPVRNTTLEAIEYFKQNGIVPDLVYVDASHEEEDVYNDIATYFPLIKGHGIICGDDWGYGNDLPVQRAVVRFARENNLKIKTPNNWFWELHEKGKMR